MKAAHTPAEHGHTIAAAPNPAAVELQQFPDGLLDHLVSAAGAAPSLHNTQPWRIVHHGDGLALHVDRDRVLPATDPHGLAARISCGAALLNLRVAASLGYHCTVRLLPDPQDPTLLARVRIGGYRMAGADDHRLYRAIWRRRSHRAPFLDEPLGAAALTAAADAARLEGACLDMLDEAAVRRLWRRCRAATHQASADPVLRTEHDRWTHRVDTTDGMPRGPRLPPVDAQPHVAALALPHARPVDQVRAGQALQRVLLQLTAHGAAASVLYPGCGPREDTAGPSRNSRGHAVIHLRFGYPTARPEPTNRRATCDLTDYATATPGSALAASHHGIADPTGVQP